MTTSIEQINNSTTVPPTPVSGASLYASSGRLKQMASSGKSSFLDLNIASLIVGATESDFTEIQPAIDYAFAQGANAENQYNIYIKTGTYEENVTLYDGINLIGPAPPFTSIAFQYANPNFDVTISGYIDVDFSDDSGISNKTCSINNLRLHCSAEDYSIKIINPDYGDNSLGYFNVSNCNLYETDIVDPRPMITFVHPGVTIGMLNTNVLCMFTLFKAVSVDSAYSLSFDTCYVTVGVDCALSVSGSFGVLYFENSFVYGNFNGAAGERYSVNMYLCTYQQSDGYPLFNQIVSSGSSLKMNKCINSSSSPYLVSGSGNLQQIQISGATLNYVTDKYNLEYSGVTVTDYSVSNSSIVYSPSTAFSFNNGIPAILDACNFSSFNPVYRYKYLFSKTTNNTTNLALAILTLPANKTATIEVFINGSTSNQSDATSGTAMACVLRAGGNISLVGTDYRKIVSSTGDFSLSVDTGSQSVILNATGIAASTYIWSISVTYLIY